MWGIFIKSPRQICRREKFLTERSSPGGEVVEEPGGGGEGGGVGRGGEGEGEEGEEEEREERIVEDRRGGRVKNPKSIKVCRVCTASHICTLEQIEKIEYNKDK